MKSVEEAKVLAAYGQYNRKIGSTVLNQKSSRRCVWGGGVVCACTYFRIYNTVVQ